MKAFFKKITAYTWAFIALIAVFFTAGICTLGDVRTAGDSITLKNTSTAYFTITPEDDEILDAIYVKVNNYYAAKGDALTITAKIATSTTPAETTWSTTTSYVASIINESNGTEMSAEAQNWIAVGTGINRSIRTISLSVNRITEIAEIVCVSDKGNVMAIKGYKPTYGSFPASALTAAYDAQKSFTANENAYYNFTAEEAFYLNAVKNLLAGNRYVDNGDYVVDTNYNYFATLLFAPSVATFGGSVFSMRLPAFIATCVLIVFAYLFVRTFTKNEKYAFIFAVLLCVGGLVTTVGRLGAPYAFVASALVASVYFMYNFYAKGISNSRVFKDGLNILLSGAFAAVAMVIDLAAIVPAAAIAVFFLFGLRRQKLAYQVEMKKAAGKEEQITTDGGEVLTVNRAEKTAQSNYARKTRVSWGFALLSFVMLTIVLTIFSATVCYAATVRANGNVDYGFLANVWHGLKYSLRSYGEVPFALANDSNVWAWWLPIKAATVYTGANGVADGKYLAWNIAPNLIVSVLSLAAVIGVTVKVAYDFAKGNTDKKALRIRRTYFILLAGLAAAMIGGSVKLYVSPIHSLFFHVLYTAFLPLAAMMLPEELCKGKKIIVEIALWTVVGLSVACFALGVPSMYGIVVSENYAKVFGWTTFISNGYFR